MRSSLVVVGLLAALAGCLTVASERCADGTLCPGDVTCAPVAGCAEPADILACTALDDGAACELTPGIGICSGGVCTATRCGDGLHTADEACDDGNAFGGDGCNAACTSDETCGNGLTELAEACDCGDEAHPGAAICDGSFNGGEMCRLDCTLARCGDGVASALEICDDGNVVSGDGCAGDCGSDESCGNGVTDFAAGEQCDDANLDDHDGCQSTCVIQRCGDGCVDDLDGEVRDDGNLASGDGCSGDCAAP